MNVIVSNKQKELLDNANIDAIKDLNGLFNVDELINNFKDYFFSSMIIDATSIVDFAKESVLTKLVNAIGAEKIILFLPSRPEPPQKFKELLISLGIFNFSTNISDIVRMLKNPKNLEQVQRENNITVTNSNNASDNSMITNNTNFDDSIKDVNADKKIVIGFKNITEHAGSTTLIYMIKHQLESNFNVNVEALELEASDFTYFNANKMINVNPSNLEMVISNSKSDIILIDLNNTNYNALCDDVLYIIEPSIIKINKLFSTNHTAFMNLKNKKVILNKSMLDDNDVRIFGNEAGLKIFYNIPFVNDRLNNDVINDFIKAMGITSNQGHGLFGIFK